MKFPYSFWGSDPFTGLPQTLRLDEDFTNFFIPWMSAVQTLQFSDNLNSFFDAIWNATVQTSQLSDNFNSGW